MVMICLFISKNNRKCDTCLSSNISNDWDKKLFIPLDIFSNPFYYQPMITQKAGDLLKAKDVNIIVHQANLYHTFGAGIAAAIRVAFPEAYEADRATVKGDESRLGTYSFAKIKSPIGKQQYVVNLYSQTGIGSKDRQTSYDALVTALEALRDKLVSSGHPVTIGVPWRLGSGLANGSWPIVETIIKDVFKGSIVDVIIYQRPEDVNV
jgi:O-acetyl-ADP-ribose deacetylase (regulator of RNase III)